MKRVLDLATGRGRESAPAKADRIQPDESCTISRDHRKGRRIERQHRPTRSHDGFPYTCVLMEPGVRAEHREIIDLGMACEPTETGNDRMISNLTVVADMRAVHDVIVITNTRAAPTKRGSNMNRDLFANLCPFTNLEARRLTVKSPVLGLCPEACVRKDSTIRADLRPTQKRDMSADFDTRPEFHLTSNEREWTDHDASGQHRSVFDACGRMDVGQGFSPFR